MALNAAATITAICARRWSRRRWRSSPRRAPPASLSRKPRAWPVSAQARRIATSATQRRCWRKSHCAGLNVSLQRWPPPGAAAGPRVARLRGARPRLPRVCSRRAGLLRGDVRDAYRVRQPSGAARCWRSCLRHRARGGRAAYDKPAARAAPTFADGGAARLGIVAWHCVTVRARRSVAAKATDVAGRPSGGRCADLSAKSRTGGQFAYEVMGASVSN